MDCFIDNKYMLFPHRQLCFRQNGCSASHRPGIWEADYNTSFHILNENLKHLEKLANVEIVRADKLTFGSSSEPSAYSVEDLINRNVDGILFAPTTDQVLPIICRMCEGEKVYCAKHPPIILGIHMKMKNRGHMNWRNQSWKRATAKKGCKVLKKNPSTVFTVRGFVFCQHRLIISFGLLA